MFGIFKKKKKELKKVTSNESEYADSNSVDTPKWYQVGDGNPFDEKILDIRCVTLNIVATTGDKSIAENYTASRSDNGEKYKAYEIAEGQQFPSAIRYPHNGDELDGVVIKSQSMDEKWDIYAYGNWFYFVRSWTSELVYKVHYENTGTELLLDYIVTALEEGETERLHEQNVHSIMLTHVLGQVWPFTIPKEMANTTEREIAHYMFSQFGCKATIATPGNILNLKLVEKA